LIKRFFTKEGKNIAMLLAATIAYSLSIHVFVSPANFAPSGIMGLAMIFKYYTNVNEGVYFLIINIPLVIVAWFYLKKRYVIYTLAYTALSSLLIVLYEQIGLYQLDGYEVHSVLPPIFGGIMQGVSMGIMLKMGASTGGTDVLAAIFQRRYRHVNIERIISVFCYGVVAASYFVFNNLTSVLMSIIHIFVVEKIVSGWMKNRRNAVNFTIITDHPAEIGKKITYELRHGATLIEAKGLFSGADKTMMVCIVSYRQIPEFFALIDSFPGTFVYYSDVMGVRGNFAWTQDMESPADTQRRLERLKGENNELS
jgi:uncharacterized membrane-anchored protein YitT (DUF2179 family)